MKTATFCRLVLAAALLSGCATERWDGRIESWGSLREVLREGRKEGRVELSSAVGATSIGLGALEGLEGEVLVVDGEIWVSRSDDLTARRGAEGDRAALLALSRVEAWEERALDRTLTIAELEQELAPILDALGHEDPGTLPFVIECELESLDAHVLAGRCPYSEVDDSGRTPVRFSRKAEAATLVGFFTELPPGVLTHRGSPLHVHVLTRGREPFVGHVDDARIGAGAVLKVPSRD